MAKKTKDLDEELTTKTAKSDNVKKAKKTPATKKTTTKSTSTKKTRSTKATATKKTSETKKTTKATKATATKKATTTKKPTKTVATKKNTTSKRKNEVNEKKKTLISNKNSFVSEYYDLPYRYNKTVVKVLAQTPKTLFIYWEISEDDRNKLKKAYGENFFEITKPVLIVHNNTLNYSFEVDINDFANSWYLHINDSKCDYHVELGRRPLPTANQNIAKSITSENLDIDIKENSEISLKAQNVQTAYIPYYVFLTASNDISAPNNKVLFNINSRTISFRNVKTGQVTEKDIRNFSFITNYGIFNIRELYKYLYPNENFEYDDFFSGNPSSGNPSSGSFSSQFR